MKLRLKKFVLILTFITLTFGTAFAKASLCDSQQSYWFVTGAVFWGSVQTGGCDYIDGAGCLVHVEVYAQYRLWINFGSYDQVTTLCPTI